jgi:hypothetical protein
MVNRIVSCTDYARLTRRQARAVLAVAAILLVAGVAITLSPLASGNILARSNRPGDVPLYRAEVDRIHRGEGYYQAAAAELVARGYPTRSVFNWRMPLPVWLLGKMPTVMLGKALLGLLALALMLMAFEALAREEDNVLRRPVACALLLVGPLLPTIVGDLFVMPVLWAGVLIALSACAYGISRPWLGVTFGLAALFFRELALPYVVVCAAIAWHDGRRRELTAWTAGLLVWMAYFGLHWWRVSALIGPGAHAHKEGWIQFGGAGFVIATAQMNAFMLLLPQGAAACYLAAALVGLAGWNTPLGRRIGLTVCLFLVTFSVVGHSFNQYWGSLIAPLLCFGVARCPGSLRDLYRVATAK